VESVSYKNGRGETFGVADGFAFLTKAGADLGGDLSVEALRSARAEVVPCEDLHETRLHEDAARSVALITKNGVRPTDVSIVRVETRDEAAQREFVAAVVAGMRPTQETRVSSLATDLLGPSIIGVFVAVVGAVVISTAFEVANGAYRPTGRSGKAGTIARLSEAIARALGVTGSIAVFGLLLLLCVAWVANVVRHKHMVTRWRVA
jgi:hypothetical protein